jgi:hypothetical protein
MKNLSSLKTKGGKDEKLCLGCLFGGKMANLLKGLQTLGL